MKKGTNVHVQLYGNYVDIMIIILVQTPVVHNRCHIYAHACTFKEGARTGCQVSECWLSELDHALRDITSLCKYISIPSQCVAEVVHVLSPTGQ